MLENVIIIDDDPISILVSETMMVKNGFAGRIKSFEDPNQALVYFKNEHAWEAGVPDYIFLDVQMPQMDAWEFMKKYVAIDPRIQKTKHIILLSATFNPEDEEAASDHAMVLELITKPINAQILERLK
ncbi:MAG: response regulator [Cryomorphaceae bacterium]